MATVLNLTPTGGLPCRGRPSQGHPPRPGSLFLSPSFFSVHHSTSALRSTSPNILVGSAGEFPSSVPVSHDLEINPWEVALADHHVQAGGQSSAAQNLEVDDIEVDRRRGLSPRSTWEQQASLRKRGLPSPALVVVHDGGVKSVEERRLKRARTDEEALGEGRTDRSRRLSTASRLAYLSPPPLEPTTSTDSSSRADSLPPADPALPSKPSPKKTKPLSASPSFAIPSVPIAPSPESSDLFSRAHLQQEPRPASSELRIQSYDIAPRPIDLVPSPRLENLPVLTFYSTAPLSFSPDTEPAPPSTFIPEAEAESYSAPSPNLPPRPQSIFLPPLSRTPTLTPSASALKAARTPPAPPSQCQHQAAASKDVKTEVVSAAPSTAAPSEKTAASKKKMKKVADKRKDKAKEPVLDALERNRIAAQKCRVKKKEKVQGLAETEQALSEANSSLHDQVSSLQADLAFLRSEVEQRHPPGGCACAEVQWWRAQTEAHDAVKAEEAHWEAEGRELRGQQDMEEETDKLDDEDNVESRNCAGKVRVREGDEVVGPARLARNRAKK